MRVIWWALAVLLGAVFLWVATLNAIVLWQGGFRRKKTSSWIPLLAGVSGSLALIVARLPQLSRWWWIPLILDWGSIPGLLFTLGHRLFIRQDQPTRE